MAVVADMTTLLANPTLLAVCAEGFLTRVGFGMVGFVLPLYALSLGFQLHEVGILYTLRTGTTILVKPAMGWAADRFGRKRVLVLAVCLRCLVGLLFALSTQAWQLYLLRVLQGTMTAARDPSASALIAEHADKRGMASAFAWYVTARDLGHAFGYAAAGLLLYATGSYQIVFLIAFFTSCAALVPVLRYVREHREAEGAERPVPAPVRPPVPPAARHGWTFYRGLLPAAGFGLLVAGSAEMMKGLFPVIATQYAHLTEAEAGLAAGASAVAVLVGGPLFGWLADHVSRQAALSTRSLANFVSSPMYLLFPTFGGFLVARVVDDTGKAAFRPSWGALLAEASDADPARRARVISFLDSGYTLGEVLAPVVAGALLAGFGLPGMLGVRAALSLTAEVQAAWAFRHQRHSREAAFRVFGHQDAADTAVPDSRAAACVAGRATAEVAEPSRSAAPGARPGSRDRETDHRHRDP
ncbi:MAG TPA: MFS transporter [Chloroflexota bacterium]|jgi:MFS family permease|nr:MFS transporter [Chloroflexota bacterium]